MTKYILHGGKTTLENDLNKKFFSEIGRNLEDGDSILMCYFAPSENSDLSEKEKFDRGVRLFQEHITDKKINYIFALRDKFIEQLEESDVLYMHGGGTDELYNDLKQFSKFSEEMKNKKLVIGSSAGAYVLAKYSVDYTDRSVAEERFGILPIKIYAHYEDKDKELLMNKFNKVDLDNVYELVLLRDCETAIYIQ